jgi:rare lipoprotein A
MANGKMFDPKAMSAAMLGVPLGTVVTVERQDIPSPPIQVTITDRYPYATGRVIDLTKGAFQALVGNTNIGLVPVTVDVPQPGR